MHGQLAPHRAFTVPARADAYALNVLAAREQEREDGEDGLYLVAEFAATTTEAGGAAGTGLPWLKYSMSAAMAAALAASPDGSLPVA